MKILDAQTRGQARDTHVEGRMVMDDVEITEDEKLTIQTRAVTSQYIASLAPKSAPAVSKKLRPLSERETGSIARLQAEFLHVSLPLFFADQQPVRSIGVTSAVAGEGKTLSALLASHALATSSRRPVLLVECDWDRPTLARDLH